VVSFDCSVRRPYGFKIRHIVAMPSKGVAATRHGPGCLLVFPNSRKGRAYLRALEYRTESLSCSASHPQPASMSASYISTSAFSRLPSRCRPSTNQLASPRAISVLHARGVGRVVLEAMGSYARKIISALVEAGSGQASPRSLPIRSLTSPHDPITSSCWGRLKPQANFNIDRKRHRTVSIQSPAD
jgi:hypothetical protein